MIAWNLTFPWDVQRVCMNLHVYLYTVCRSEVGISIGTGASQVWSVVWTLRKVTPPCFQYNQLSHTHAHTCTHIHSSHFPSPITNWKPILPRKALYYLPCTSIMSFLCSVWLRLETVSGFDPSSLLSISSNFGSSGIDFYCTVAVLAKSLVSGRQLNA